MTTPFEQTALLMFLRQEQPVLYGKIAELRTAVQGWLEYIPQTFPHYTRHTVAHSDAILLQMSKLLFTDNDPSRPTLNISPAEAHIAASAAYLHDAGMVISDKGKADILQSDAWKEWTSGAGQAAQRWAQVQHFRGGNSPSDESLRHFLADVQTRFLIAEFVRRTHHLRARDILTENEDQLGRFAFNNPVLLRTIGDVCIAHGLHQRDLEDRDRYPDRRDIDGQEVNVRFLAILLRIGDLLEMSCDRACPLLLSAACPLPAESLAHWSQYHCISHSLTAPDRIELTAECATQDEHRFLSDWCQWLVEEVRNAAVLLGRSHRHSEWQLPTISMEGPDPTIRIRPAADATYIPSNWKFEFDADAVFTRLIEDIYDHPGVFVRELLQNAFDATRCQLYLDSASAGQAPPEFPTQVEETRRANYPIRVTLEERLVKNELSGEDELRHAIVVEDVGLGMDRDIVLRYLLQVGRSFYTTHEFQRSFKFVPSSRFGVGFLSVFGVSDRVGVETFKPTSLGGDGPLRIVLTGPRNYLLIEKGQRQTRGTRIEVLLRQPMKAGELTENVGQWCRRVEFPIYVNDLGKETIVRAEKAGDFAVEVPDVSEPGAKFVVRAFDVNRHGIEGELYVFEHIDEKGASWANWHWAQYKYPEISPQASPPPFPPNVHCMNGIDVGGAMSYWSRPLAERLDFRDGSLVPLLSRTSTRHHHRSQQTGASSDKRVVSRWEEILVQHLDSAQRAKSESAWAYKQRLIEYFPFHSFWETVPGTLPFHTASGSRFTSLREALAFPLFAAVILPDLLPRRYLPEETTAPKLILEDETPTLTEDELQRLSDNHRGRLFDGRSVKSISWSSNGYMRLLWAATQPDDVLLGSKDHLAYLVKSFNPRLVGIEIHKTLSDVYPSVILNSENPLVRWLLRTRSACMAGEHGLAEGQFDRLYELVLGATRFGKYQQLNVFLRAWQDMALPVDLRPQLAEVDGGMFHFTKGEAEAFTPK